MGGITRQSIKTANGAASDERKETAISIPEAHTKTAPAVIRVLISTEPFLSVGKRLKRVLGVFLIYGTNAPANSIITEHTAQTINPLSRKTPSALPITMK